MRSWIALCLLSLLGMPQESIASSQAIVVAPAVDVWSKPLSDPAQRVDDLRETQLLFGERVRLLERRGDWVRIEALEQSEFTHHRKWEGYPGWIDTHAIKKVPGGKESAAGAVTISTWTGAVEPEAVPDVWLFLGSFIRSMGKTDGWFVIYTPLGDRCLTIHDTKTLQAAKPPSRQEVLGIASKMMGLPYLWGGLTTGNSATQSLGDKSMKQGVDCSGLVHLSYRVNGLTVPRDSHEQWMKAAKIKRAQLMPADLIFSAEAKNPKKVVHVALYDGNDQLIEAPQTGMVVRKISFKEKFGTDLSSVESGDEVGKRVLYFGRLIND